MDSEIKNRVADSNLVTIDLEDFYPIENRIELDISQWLYEGSFLQEKDFREQLKNHHWKQYQDCYIAITNTTKAIIPSWAFMLLTVQLTPYAKKISIGNLEQLESLIFSEIISELNIDQYKNKSVIIKGCSNHPIPESAFIQVIQLLQPIVKSIMYGEACSSVPLFKKK